MTMHSKGHTPAKHHEKADSPIADNTAFTVPDKEKNPTPGETTNATEPWAAENDPNHPTHRGILAVHHKRKGFVARWVNENQVDRRKMQGYTLAKPGDYNVEGEDGKVRRNEMILMDIPQAEYDKNRAGIHKRTEDLARSAKADYRREVGDASRRTGGGVEATDESRSDE